MKNEVFAKYSQSATSANNLAVKMYQDNDRFFPHSLVFITAVSSSGKCTVYNVFANCRQSSVEAVIKSFARIYLQVERELAVTKNKMANSSYSKRIVNPLKPCLSAEVIAVTDKNGCILNKSVISCANLFGIDKVNKLFGFCDKLDLYHNVVVNGVTWSSETVQKQISTYVQSVSLYIKMLSNLSDTIVSAAKLNDEDFKKDVKSINEKYLAAGKMLHKMQDAVNKANMTLDAAKKAVEENTDKSKALNLKKAVNAAEKAAKEAVSNLEKTQKYFESVEKEYNEIKEAA